MNWRLKARLLSTAATLPDGLSSAVLLLLQRIANRQKRGTGGALWLRAAARTLRAIPEDRLPFEGKTFMEIGTGRGLILSVALWLCGAKRVVSIDLRRYLTFGRFRDDLDHLRTHPDILTDALGEFAKNDLFEERWTRLKQALAGSPTLDDLQQLMDIQYLAPADARSLDMPDNTLDFYVSFNVLEYIPEQVLDAVVEESRRVLKPDGCHVHCLDCGDYFAVADPAITSINFLQFSQEEWARYANNRYAYENRLRVDDYAATFERAGFVPTIAKSIVDPRALAALQAGFSVHDEFKNKSPEMLATKSAWLIARALSS
jgi:SAM-dependent methyltransferase